LLVTVDDLPIAAPGKHRDPAERERITRGLLAALAKHKIQAVGLVTWQNLLRPSDTRLLEQWLAAGHELGNHSYSHLDYTTTDSTQYIADIERGRDELARFLEPRGKKVRFFRFPFLREGDTLAKLNAMRSYLVRSGQRNLPVTIDDEDWAYEEPWLAASAANDRAAMGTLSFDIIEIRLTSGMEASVLGSARPAGIQGASVVAKWTLAYPAAGTAPARPNATGTTLLVLRPRGGGKWEILQDASL
jgi:peptidoglycan/xylan/chitin deacetylase (PgdA/CDA1 family)